MSADFEIAEILRNIVSLNLTLCEVLKRILEYELNEKVQCFYEFVFLITIFFKVSDLVLI